MDNIQRQVVTTALKKMFTSSHFSICTIDNCVKLSGVIPDNTVYNTMRPLHCIDYKDMPEEVRDWLLEKVKEMFDYDNSFDLSFFDQKPKQRTLYVAAETVEPEPEKKKLSLGQRFLRLGS